MGERRTHPAGSIFEPRKSRRGSVCCIGVPAANDPRYADENSIEFTGAPERIRTSDLCLRRAALYPAELRARSVLDSGRGIERQRHCIPCVLWVGMLRKAPAAEPRGRNPLGRARIYVPEPRYAAAHVRCAASPLSAVPQFSTCGVYFLRAVLRRLRQSARIPPVRHSGRDSRLVQNKRWGGNNEHS